MGYAIELPTAPAEPGAPKEVHVMNINTATRLLNNARAAVKAGDAMTAARLGLAAQVAARQCRAAARDDVSFSGHCIAAYWAAKVLDVEKKQSLRSEAGRIKADTYRIGF